MARPPSIDDDTLLDELIGVFRARGFSGTAIADLTEASGLKRASLYYRYPDGKDQMAAEVLTQVGKRFRWILAPLTDHDDVAGGIRETAERLGSFYGAGALSCVLDSMTLGGAPQPIRDQARDLATAWIEAMATAARRAGHPAAAADEAARTAFLQVEGSLVLARVLGDTSAFLATLGRLPALLMP